jgi:uncharacterized protein YndB with AHSA1/START domain
VAFTSRQIDASPADVFAVLIDPETYPDWLVGTDRIRHVEPDWPAIGSKFHHVVGFGPFKIADSTEVIGVVEGRMLRLKVRARPFISALATLRVVGESRRCVVTFEEEPAIRTIGNLVRPVLDPMTHVRNHRSLRRLARVVEASREQASAGA